MISYDIASLLQVIFFQIRVRIKQLIFFVCLKQKNISLVKLELDDESQYYATSGASSTLLVDFFKRTSNFDDFVFLNELRAEDPTSFCNVEINTPAFL